MTLTVETWCEALESGRYKQAKAKLRDGDGFCCLGVACDVSAAGKWSDNDWYRGQTFDCESFLPDPIQNALGLFLCDGNFEFDTLPPELRREIEPFTSTPSSLAELNDAGVPFPLIAKVIRARPKGLFREDAA